MAKAQPFPNVHAALRQGALSRRAFIRRAAALGVQPAVIAFVLQAGLAVTPEAGAVADAARPAIGTETQQRGAGGELKILQWQAPAQLAAFAAGGANDLLAAAPISEPLLSYLPDGTLIPTLAREVPSSQNGLLAADLTRVTYTLQPDITWSDGVPLTAADVVFTWRWLTDPANAAISAFAYEQVADVRASDDLTVQVTFNAPNPAWFVPFVGSGFGHIYPEHVLAAGSRAVSAFSTDPIGTGPYVVASFAPADNVQYAVNEYYREPNKPYFSRINLKGGGDAASAARAVLQTGDFDFAWSLLVDPDLLAELEKGGQGRRVTVPGTTVQRIAFNFSDPDQEVDGQRSQWQTPHPFLTDRAVRQALTLATDRLAMSTQFFDGPPGEPPVGNILVGIPAMESRNTIWAFDLEEAARVLDDAGWQMIDGVRQKDGRRLEVIFATAASPVLQQIQQVCKFNWEQIGVGVELRQVEASVFFDNSAGNVQGLSHFSCDLLMFASGPSSPFPLSYMNAWYSDNGRNIAQKENGWARLNESRYDNPEFDRLYEAAATETDGEKAAQLFIAMNDLLIADYAAIPLVQRAAEKYGISHSLRDENIAASSWEVIYWNIANWNRIG